MRIAIDLNDVIRNFSQNFLKVYVENYNRDFDLSDFEFWSNNMAEVFSFKSDNSYYNFIYNDYAFELYGKCNTMTTDLVSSLDFWTERILQDLDCDEEISVMFVSPKEYGKSIGNTFFFLSKLGVNIRETYFPIDSSTIWDRCDVLITANPQLLESKPKDKITVKIHAEYNKEDEADFSYRTASSFFKNKENTEKVFELWQKTQNTLNIKD